MFDIVARFATRFVFGLLLFLGAQVLWAAEDVTDKPTAEAASAEVKPIAGAKDRLVFSFRHQPWAEVLDWFAKQADLSLVMDSAPPGTFNYQDTRSYTPAEAIDLLNGVLLTKGYTLVRRDRMVMLINIEDGIPPNLVPMITPAELSERGKFELVSVVFRVNRLTSEEAEQEVSKLIGPQGKVVSLPKVSQIIVTETAGRMRTICDVLEAVEDPLGAHGDRVRAFDLRNVTPREAMSVIRQLMNIPDDKNATPDGSLRLVLDDRGRRILASGKGEQVRRVEDILRAVDVQAAGDAYADHSNRTLRMVPLSGRSMEDVLKKIEALWPTMSQNKIRIVSPSSAISIMRSPQESRRDPSRSPRDRDRDENVEEPVPPKSLPLEEPAAEGGAQAPIERSDATTSTRRRVRAFTVQADESSKLQKNDDSPIDVEREIEKLTGAASPIVIAPTQGGLMIASQDTKALDQLERLLNTLAAPAANGGREYTVFYLKYARAQPVADLIRQIMTGATVAATTRDNDDDRPPFDFGGAFGGFGGGPFGGGGGGGRGGRSSGGGDGDGEGSSPTTTTATTASTSTAPKIVPDSRLNALFVQGKADDLDTIEQLLRVLDQEEGPEDVKHTARPRLIPVEYTSADSVATVVQQIYQDRMKTGNANNQQQQQQGGRDESNPWANWGRGRGGRGGDGRGDSNNNTQRQNNQQGQDETAFLTVGVDARSNSLVVSAPDPLFYEIEDLVHQLDRPSESTQSVQVVSIKRGDPAEIQRTLTAITGGNVTSTSSTSSTAGGVVTSTTPGNQNNANQGNDDARRQEFFNRMRERFGEGRGGDSGGRGDRGRGEWGGRGGDRGGDRGGRGGDRGGGR